MLLKALNKVSVINNYNKYISNFSPGTPPRMAAGQAFAAQVSVKGKHYESVEARALQCQLDSQKNLGHLHKPTLSRPDDIYADP